MTQERRLVWFRRLARAGALLAAGVVVLGAWVRLTNAGLGCPDWPGCYGHLFPQNAHHFAEAVHEMVHRYFASTLGAIIVGLLVFAWVNRRGRGQPLLAVALLFLLVCLQGALGMKTVTLLLQPLIVTAHLLGGLSTLGLLWWLSIEPRQRPLTHPELSLRKFALLAIGALALQIALGGWTSSNYAAIACPDLPTCQRSWWPDMDFRDAFVLWRGLGVDYEGGVLASPARVAIHFTHRLGAAVAGSFLIVTGLLVVALLQITIGVAMVHFHLPLPLATLHNGGAAFLVIVMVTLLRTLWPRCQETAPLRAPEPASAMVPLRRVDAPR
jgi:cytochrome c oxidase assembly protein subunit 15